MTRLESRARLFACCLSALAGSSVVHLLGR
jgi:hypothetical protein